MGTLFLWPRLACCQPWFERIFRHETLSHRGNTKLYNKLLFSFFSLHVWFFKFKDTPESIEADNGHVTAFHPTWNSPFDCSFGWTGKKTVYCWSAKFQKLQSIYTHFFSLNILSKYYCSYWNNCRNGWWENRVKSTLLP